MKQTYMFFLFASSQIMPPDITYADYVITLLVNDDVKGWQLEKMGTLPLWVRSLENNIRIFAHLKFFKEHFYGQKEEGRLICEYSLPCLNNSKVILALQLKAHNRNFQPRTELLEDYHKRKRQWIKEYKKLFDRHMIAHYCNIKDFEYAHILNFNKTRKEEKLGALYIESFSCRSHDLAKNILKKALEDAPDFIEARERIKQLDDTIDIDVACATELMEWPEQQIEEDRYTRIDEVCCKILDVILIVMRVTVFFLGVAGIIMISIYHCTR